MSLVKTVFCSHGDAETQSDMVNSLRPLRTLREPEKGISRRVRRERRVSERKSLRFSASPREPYFTMSPATSTVTLNLFQGLTSSASSRIKMLKQVQHDEVGEVR